MSPAGTGFVFFFFLGMAAVVWWAVEQVITIHGNKPGCGLKILYYVASVILLVFLAILAIGFFTYPLRNP